MALGSSWPSSPSATHFQLHVTARCLCGREVQQLRELIWWEKQILLALPCSLFGRAGSCASTAQDTSPGTEGPLEEPQPAPVIALWKRESLQSTHSNSPEFALLFQLLPAGIGRSFNISVIYLAQLYSTSAFSIQHSWGWAHLKNGKGGCAQ